MENTAVYAKIDSTFITRLEEPRNQLYGTYITVPMKHNKLMYQKRYGNTDSDTKCNSSDVIEVDVSFYVYDMSVNKAYQFMCGQYFVDVCKRNKGKVVVLSGTMQYPEDGKNCYFDSEIITNFVADTNLD